MERRKTVDWIDLAALGRWPRWTAAVVAFVQTFPGGSAVYAADGEIFLSCRGVEKADFVTSRGLAPTETRNVIFSVQIVTTGDTTAIFASGDGQQGSVTTAARPGFQAVDISNENKWEISTRRKLAQDDLTQSFVIDRLTGRLSYKTALERTESTSTVSVEATCEKLDPSKKKF